MRVVCAGVVAAVAVTVRTCAAAGREIDCDSSDAVTRRGSGRFAD